MGGHRKIGRQELRWGGFIRKDNEGERSKARISTMPNNVEFENAMLRFRIGKCPKKKMGQYMITALPAYNVALRALQVHV